ncbi:MAG: biotin/lipoyl-containing protein [Mucinivorans sp.]
MAQKLKIRDLTLRDGQQSSFATRMTQAQVDRVLPFYKDAHFYAMEVWGGAVPDSVMRYLAENPWHRLEKIKAAVGDVSKLTALSRGRNLFGYAPYTDQIIDGFCRNAMESGLSIMRIFDALNDVDNVKATIKYVKKYGGIADCAICYTIDPKPTAKTTSKGLFGMFKKTVEPQKVFTDGYFLDKARQMKELGADMITIKDMSGLIPPKRVYDLVKLLKTELDLPIDFHTHCTPGYGLASVVSAIAAGVDIVDTNIWNFSGGPAAPSIEFIYLFCKKMGVELDVNMEAVAKINHELFYIRKELAAYDAVKQYPKPFNPLTEAVPAEIDALIDQAVKAARNVDEATLIDVCQKIEAYYNFPAPNELVKNAEIPGGMYTNMVAQLKALKAEDILENAMLLIPEVRAAAGLIPLVTPTSQIIGAQAVNCALDVRAGKPMYTNCSNQFVGLVKGEYGKTPVPVDPEFRLKITGSREEIPYDTSKYQMQPNPQLAEAGGVLLAENEKEVLLLELFPQVAKDYLTKLKVEAYKAKNSTLEVVQEVKAEKLAITGQIIESPMPGRVFQTLVKVGDKVTAGQDVIILEAMKMENNISTPYAGTVRQILVADGDSVAAGAAMVEIS